MVKFVGILCIYMFVLFIIHMCVCIQQHTHTQTHTTFADNPVLISNRLWVGIELVRHHTTPFLDVFGSGTPQPANSNYTWFFNGSVISSADSSSAPGVLTVLPTRVLFVENVMATVEGIYRCELSTSAGLRNVSIHVIGEGNFLSFTFSLNFHT